MPTLSSATLLRQTARPLGKLLYVLAGTMAACTPVGLLMGTTDGLVPMLVSAFICAAVGGALTIWGRHIPTNIGRREALLVVALAWLSCGVFGGLPFILGAHFSFADAFFEAVSGFTTTGATILPEIEERLSIPLHFWRTLTHWLGGLGIVVLFVALFPALGMGGRHLFRTESAGPASQGLAPRIRDTAAVLWRVYLVLTLAEVALLWVAMPSHLVDGRPIPSPLFEAITHSFGTLGTGGFSTHNGSIADFGSPWVDLIITVFMVAAGANFSLFAEARKHGLKPFLRDTEFKVYLGIFLGCTLVVSIDLLRGIHENIFTALRFGAFQVASIMTTTGFGTDDFAEWPALSQAVLVMLYFLGGCAGSTAGGMKIVRIVMIVRLIKNELQRVWRPNLVAPVRLGRAAVAPTVLLESLALCFAFLASVIVGGLLVALFENTDLVTALMASLACVANVGPGLGDVGPIHNFGFFGPGTKLMLSMLMLLGRLEFFVLLAIFSPAFWRR